ncbi:MAG: histidinol-phosphatase [Gammaproteobacteria bacterium]
MTSFTRVSVHGGHSGQFCHHAKDSLEAVVQAYVDAGFAWAGITEHMPPLDDSKRYFDEADSNIAAAALQEQFKRYFAECRRLQQQFAGKIRLFCAFETETYSGSSAFVKQLIAQTQPDYIVGSVHHVGDIGIDETPALYAAATAKAGGLEALYCNYFDAQHAMLQDLMPAVVGHFDLVRIFDRDYLTTLQLPNVWMRIERNLAFIRQHDLIMDFNLRGFDKSTEQYPSMPVLRRALELGVSIVPGDDSHGVSSVGRNYDRGAALLAELGHSCRWAEPKLYAY